MKVQESSNQNICSLNLFCACVKSALPLSIQVQRKRVFLREIVCLGVESSCGRVVAQVGPALSKYGPTMYAQIEIGLNSKCSQNHISIPAVLFCMLNSKFAYYIKDFLKKPNIRRRGKGVSRAWFSVKDKKESKQAALPGRMLACTCVTIHEGYKSAVFSPQLTLHELCATKTLYFSHP